MQALDQEITQNNKTQPYKYNLMDLCYRFFNCCIHIYRYIILANLYVACVAGGSGCMCKTFCGEAANSLAGEACEGIFVSTKAVSEIQQDSTPFFS